MELFRQFIELREEQERLTNLINDIQENGFEINFIKKKIYLYKNGIAYIGLDCQNIEREKLISVFLIKESKSRRIQEIDSYFIDYFNANLKDIVINLEIENLFLESKAYLLEELFMLEQLISEDLTVDFRINSIKFEEYKCFKDEEITFEERITVLVGKNASGKTSILDAISVAIGAYLSGIDESTDTKSILKSDVRFTSKDVHGTKVVKHHAPTRINFNSDFINKRFDWSRTRSKLKSTKLTTKDSKQVVNLSRFLYREINNNDLRNITLPVFSYHGTGRVANFTKNMNQLEKTENISRFFGYKDCLKPASNYKTFISWYSKMQYRAFMLNKRIEVLDQVTKCLKETFVFLTEEDKNKVSDVIYLEGSLHLKYSNGDMIPIEFLSDGYKDIIGIISDIAYRMAILNPHLEKDVIKATPGIVLIDEIDLHLHPRWQQKIIKLLKNLFPKVQFVVTTHSALVVSSTEYREAKELKVVEENLNENFTIVAEIIGDSKEWYIHDILRNVFHVDPLLHTRLTSEYIDQDEVDDLINDLNEYVKKYLVSREEHILKKINTLNGKLNTCLTPNTPKKRVVDALMEMVR
ncbi:AAA family ATPase [Lysinibacillus sphaericus]|nr:MULTISPECIES: AAA family ATPase [Lysinibacillus]MBE5084384.1 AAA family ATPase [Bacillus thuringiensis]AMO32286.1 hypothetical protein AR327_07300 [Lysinibacillus sphaericus]AMR92615.1 hypothetical protein A1T07_21910 [Lysinibacillus sphaericus]ANA46664.1 hypothetical protein A2J09_14580 [Lysinibacillus sphaericus]KZL46077.1 hypothetical protein A2J08_14935 [Lysinibacillus sphaericus]